MQMVPLMFNNILTDKNITNTHDVVSPSPIIIPMDNIKITDEKDLTSNPQNPHVIVKYHDQQTVNYPDKILLSDYVLPGGIRALNRITKQDQLYFVSLMYNTNPNITSSRHLVNDTQLFLTRSIKNGETSHQGALGCIKEKLNMRPINDSFLKPLFTRETATRTIHWYGCCVKKLKLLSQDKNVRKEIKMQTTDKIVCILHGTYSEIMDFLMRIPKQTGDNNLTSACVCMKMSNISTGYNYILHKHPKANIYWPYVVGNMEEPDHNDESSEMSNSNIV